MYGNFIDTACMHFGGVGKTTPLQSLIPQNAQSDSAAAASRYLKDMAVAGVLEEIKRGKEKVFIHPKLIHLLIRASNEFAHYV